MTRSKPAARRLNGRVLWLLVLASGLIGSCGSPDTSEGPDILIVVLDACRTDKLSCYGHGRPTSPTIDAVAADPDGVIFRRHYVQAPWTKPSTASLFTGLLPHQHGVLEGREKISKVTGENVYATQALHESFVTMPEYFSALGYRTFAALNMVHLHARYGFRQGFHHWTFGLESSDEEQVRDALSIGRESTTRTFGYVHLRGCHSPYKPEDRDPEYMTAFGFDYDESSRQSAGVDFTVGTVNHAIRNGDVTLDSSDERFLHLVYEAKLRQVDRGAIDVLIEELKESGRYDNTLLIITADHGEELHDHGSYGHSGLLWEDVVHVPLIVKFPRGQKPNSLGTEVNAITRTVDLLPSLLAFVGAPVPQFLPGTRIFDEEFAGHALTEMIWPKTGVIKWALLQDDFKMVNVTGESQLFNVIDDPQEQEDLAAESPDLTKTMSALASDLLAASAGVDLPSAPDVETLLDGTTLEELRSLGYVR